MNDTFTSQPSAPQMPPAAPAAAPPPAPAAYPVPGDQKSPVLAGFLSMFPGLGHLYLGLYPRAFAVGGAFVLLISFTSHGRGGEFFGPLIAFVWFFAVIDAVRQAKAMNRGQLAEAGFAGEKQLRVAAGSGSLVWGVVLIGLGSLWMIDRYVDIDWSFMEEWGGPLAFILLGFVLIIGHIVKRRRENDAQMGMPPRSR